MPLRALLPAPAGFPLHLVVSSPLPASSSSANGRDDSSLLLTLLVWGVGFILRSLSDVQCPKH